MRADARTEIEKDWIARARGLRPRIDASARAIDATCTLPEDLLDALHAARMFRMFLPHTFGGAELEPATFFQVICEIAAGDASTGWTVAQSSGCSMSAAYMAPEAAQKVFGDARAVVAWGYSMGPQCRAIPVEGGWKVSGTWGFGSGNRHATWLGAHCHQADAGGTLLKHPDGRPRERTMLIPRSQVKIHEGTWDVVGLRGTGSDTYSVADLFVPAEFSAIARATASDQHLPADVVPQREPERREKGLLYRFSPMNVYQSGFSAVALGVGRAPRSMPSLHWRPRKRRPVRGSRCATTTGSRPASRSRKRASGPPALGSWRYCGRCGTNAAPPVTRDSSRA